MADIHQPPKGPRKLRREGFAPPGVQADAKHMTFAIPKDYSSITLVIDVLRPDLRKS
jgi:hypothetical protein